MFKNKNFISTLILTGGSFFGLLYFLFQKYNIFANSSFFLAIITLLVGSTAIYLYLKQKIDSKKDAAKIILQEIRRAENIIFDFKEHKQFKFTKKIIATNSWSKNIHYFVDDLSIDELDKISTLYSTGEYLDQIIKMVSDIKFDTKIHDNLIEQARQQVNLQMNKFIKGNEPITSAQSESTASVRQNKLDPALTSISSQSSINISLHFDSFASTDVLFVQIVDAYDFIYHSDICLKLRRIAGIK